MKIYLLQVIIIGVLYQCFNYYNMNRNLFIRNRIEKAMAAGILKEEVLTCFYFNAPMGQMMNYVSQILERFGKCRCGLIFLNHNLKGW